MSKRLNKTIKWDKLDNTANLFPVIVSENVSNVYRISVTLTEDIDAELLQWTRFFHFLMCLITN